MDSDDLFEVFSQPVKRKGAGTDSSRKKSRTEDSPQSRPSHSPSVASPSVSVPPSPAGSPPPTPSASSLHKKANDTFGDYAEQKVANKSVGEGVKVCRSEICYPPNYDFSYVPPARPPKPPAKEYPFVLDPFQVQAVECIEREESVLVSAHTSAGKTVVAEYAIAVALRDKQRVIYTSPIKALSNQKYRELFEEFGDVGLMTGDITINPSASCLVMTTEILRNMLYRGSEVMREVSWVVFDEVHYMNNRSRGVVWEETMIMLPDKVRCAFLSATIPNSTEFALWIAKLHGQPCHVVYTDFRPTPLQHYIYPSGGDGLYLVVNEKGVFREDNFQKALAVLGDPTKEMQSGMKSGGGKKKVKGGRHGGGESEIHKIVKMVMERHYEPAIVFSFSKRDVEANALAMSDLDFASLEEKKLIDEIFNNAIDSLSEEDKNLPQVINLLPLLRRGIGVHHGGLLPILKEVIEILFQEGLLKVLFSTETFAMGLNMPAKTVVFTAVNKWDGEAFRVISSGEYIQMSGRAGRRGLDERGIVVLMMDESLEPSTAKNMIQGEADPLNSTFSLGYNMVLNLIRVETADPEYMMTRSFYQFQANRSAPKLMAELEQKQEESKAIAQSLSRDIVEYYQIKAAMNSTRKQMRAVVNQPLHLLPFLNPGRLVRVEEEDGTDWGWGVIVAWEKKKVPEKAAPCLKPASVSAEGLATAFVVDVMIRCKQVAEKGRSKPVPCLDPNAGELEIIPVLLPLLGQLSTLRLVIPKDLRPKHAKNGVGAKLSEVFRRFPGGVPVLDPVDDLKIKDEEFVKLVRKHESLEDRLQSHALHGSPDLAQQLSKHEQRLAIDSKCVALRAEIANKSQDVVLRATLKGMKRVLRRLGFTTVLNVIDLKGRVACEISTGDELLVTELMFGGLFNDLAPDQIVALCSCLVFDERSDEKCVPKEELQPALRQLQDTARRVAEAIADSKLPMDVEEYVKKFQPHLMDIVLAWCRGAKFLQICKMSDIFEGTIIRTLRRLEELLRQLSSAAKVIGNELLENKFSEGRKLLKRDIVFAASLYL